MEKIKINKVDVKPSGLAVVNYNDNKEATMNMKWQANEIGFISGLIGGTIQAEIIQKESKGNNYINITKIDMANNESLNVVEHISRSNEDLLLSERDKLILSQMITKSAVDILQGEHFYSSEDFGKALSETSNQIMGNVKLVWSWLK